MNTEITALKARQASRGHCHRMNMLKRFNNLPLASKTTILTVGGMMLLAIATIFFRGPGADAARGADRGAAAGSQHARGLERAAPLWQ